MGSESPKEFSKIFFEKFWEIYKITDEKRVQSFYYLLTIIMVFLLFLIGNKETTLTFFGTNVEKNAAMFVFPAMISLLYLRYIYLSVLSLSNHYKFNKYYDTTKAYWASSLEDPSGEKEKEFLSKFKFDHFKSLDISELPQLLIFPAQVAKYKIIPQRIRKILQISMTIFYGIIHNSAILLFLYLIIFYERNIEIIVYLIVLDFILVMLLAYSIFRTREISEYLKC